MAGSNRAGLAKLKLPELAFLFAHSVHVLFPIPIPILIQSQITMYDAEHDCLIAALIAAGSPLPEVARQAGLTEGAVVQRMVATPTMVLMLKLAAVWHGVSWEE